MSSDGQKIRVEFQEKALKLGIWNSCLNCHYWKPNLGSRTTPSCMKFNTVPPLNVIVTSCEAWLPMTPF